MNKNRKKQFPPDPKSLWAWLYALPFVGMLKKYQRSRLRRVIRGYQSLKNSGRLDRIAVVKQALTEHPLNLISRDFSPIVMGQGAESGEIIVRQYLLARIGGIDLNRALLMALGKKRGRVVFYLPREWRNVLSRHGFEVAHFRSAVLWQLYICAHLLYGAVKIGKIALAGITSGKNTDTKTKRYVQFTDLGPGNLPQKSDNRKSHDIISWYLQWPGKRKDIDAVQHNVATALPNDVGDIAILPSQRLLPDLAGVRAITRFALWGLRAALIAVIDCFRGRWWHALLLNQAALAAQVRILQADSLAREYLFHNSNWIYRPLWTYETERKGSDSVFYFYSTNCEAFKRTNEYPPIYYGWKAVTWPRYMVWDEYQADFVRQAAGEHAPISVVGPIWFQSSAEGMPHVKKHGVAVFDVTPHRYSRYCTLGMDSEFYVPSTSKLFLEHIADVCRHFEAVMLWKRKRKIGSLVHPLYRHLAERLSKREDVALVDPDISALRVIESSCAVISMPFTSTALIARSIGKPSIYYDPTGQLQRDDRAAHGIPILQHADELEEWIAAQVKINASQQSVGVSR